jgi:hypothetical protein
MKYDGNNMCEFLKIFVNFINLCVDRDYVRGICS